LNLEYGKLGGRRSSLAEKLRDQVAASPEYDRPTSPAERFKEERGRRAIELDAGPMVDNGYEMGVLSSQGGSDEAEAWLVSSHKGQTFVMET